MRLWNGLFLCLFGMGVLSGCARTPSEPEAPAPGPIVQKTHFPKDDLGREISLQAPAQRVVCIGPGATETIFALGAGSKLVGRDQISDYPAATKTVPIVGDFTGPFPEKAAALRPDLVIVQGETYDKTRAENWQRKIGAPVAVLVPTNVNQVEQGIEKIAAWLGAREKLAAVTGDFPSKQKSPGYRHARRWSVFCEVQRSPLWAAGSGTLMDSELAALGWENVAHDVQGYKPFNTEVLLKRDPEFYIVAQEQPNQARAIADLRKSPQLRNLTAIKTGRVVVVDADLVQRPGPRLPQGILALSAGLSKLANRDKKAPGDLKD